MRHFGVLLLTILVVLLPLTVGAQEIKDYVGGGGFMFAMCSACETIDIALSAEGVDAGEVVLVERRAVEGRRLGTFEQLQVNNAFSTTERVPCGDGAQTGVSQGPFRFVHHVHAYNGDQLFHISTSSVTPSAVSFMPELMV